MWGKAVAHNTPWEQGCSLPTHPQWASWAAGPGVLAQAAWPPAACSQWVPSQGTVLWLGGVCWGSYGVRFASVVWARLWWAHPVACLAMAGCQQGLITSIFLFRGDEWTEPTMTEIGHVPHYFSSKSFLHITKPRHRCRAEVYYHQS